MFILPTRVLRIIIVRKSLVWRVAFLDFEPIFAVFCLFVVPEVICAQNAKLKKNLGML